jgi:hypothetical protein
MEAIEPPQADVDLLDWEADSMAPMQLKVWPRASADRDTKTLVDKLVSVFPIIPIAAGDLLGIFAGNIRFSEHHNTTQFIPGPIPHL